MILCKSLVGAPPYRRLNPDYPSCCRRCLTCSIICVYFSSFSLHVAGTNGKGSVCAYMRSVLEAAGKRVAVFTSPHLVDVRERFVIDGEMIGQETFLEAFLQVYDSLDRAALAAGNGYHPTFFEYLFFMAMLVFSKEKPDYCILETGLGGRLDATNAVARKEIAVITHISLDHVEYLGHTLKAIAGEKAGIMQENVPVIYADSCPEVGDVIRERARFLSADLYPVSNIDYRFSKNNNKNIDFSYISRYYGSVSLSIPTIARYQMENCSLALRALEVLAQGPDLRIRRQFPPKFIGSRRPFVLQIRDAQPVKQAAVYNAAQHGRIVLVRHHRKEQMSAPCMSVRRYGLQKCPHTVLIVSAVQIDLRQHFLHTSRPKAGI